MSGNNVDYNELVNAKIGGKRNIVVSTCSVGGYTVAQQLEVDEGGKTTKVFLKGAFHIDDISGLYNMRDALNCAIAKIEEGVEDPEDEGDIWDDSDDEE